MPSPSKPDISVKDKHDAVLVARRHNAHIPIARLPADALTLIFGFAASSNPLIGLVRVGRRAFQPPEQHATVLRWMAITHVCSFWRSVALEDSRLWSEVPSRLRTSSTEEILRRNGQRGGLVYEYVDVIPSDPRRAQRADLLERSLSLVEDLRMHLEGSATDFARVFGSAAPQLRALHVYTDITEMRRRYQLIWPDRLFAGQAPLLRTVDLRVLKYHSLVPDFLSSIHDFLHCLTTLVVDIGPHDFYDFPSLHAALSRSRNLVNLVINGSFPRLSMSPFHSELGSLDFPHLKACRIEGPIQDTGTLVAMMQIPETCRLGIRCSTDSYLQTRAYPLSQALSERFARVRTLEIAGRSMPHLHNSIAGWRASSAQLLTEDYAPVSPLDGHRRPRLLPDIELSFDVDPTNNDPFTFSRLLQHLSPSFSGVENMSFRISDNNTSLREIFIQNPRWSDIGATFQSLRWLRADRGVAESILHRRSEAKDADFVLPASLQHLALIGVQWHTEITSDEYRHQERSLRRLLQTDEDTTGAIRPSGATRSVTIGGDAGGPHEMLPLGMPDIPFMVVRTVGEENWSEDDIFDV
ncbi:unnamed protein product [Peniophora sp. CBMAI 1063]|nr:unnamed protein product [Peniophora sp. CBMAI 1063]